jgi:hypothetical protein
MLQVVESCNVSPSRSSLLTHSYMSTNTEKGIQATIFIQPPKDPSFEFVQPNSVYLTTCKENEPFDEFIYSSQEAVVLTIPMYITLLQFFRANWPAMKEKVKIQFNKIRNQTFPIQLDPYIHFSLAAMCHYEMAIEDAFLDFKKSTDDDDTSANEFCLERNSKTVWLNADTMQKFAEASVESLVNTLYKAGYVDPVSQFEHE